jgi:3-oxoacyl-[acyl-carrier-protein] synthase-3
LTDDQVYNNIQKYGNTTSIALMGARKKKSGDTVVLAAFGSGLPGKCHYKMVKKY